VSGINKRIRKIVQAKKIPDLRSYDDISDYVLRNIEFQLNEQLAGTKDSGNESIQTEQTNTTDGTQSKKTS